MRVSWVDWVKREPPLLRFYIHDAPHRRLLAKHVLMVKQYRKALLIACQEFGILVPITVPIDLSVHFINPTSPDLGNLYLGLEQALDGRSRRAVLSDDSLIQSVNMDKIYINPKQDGAKQNVGSR